MSPARLWTLAAAFGLTAFVVLRLERPTFDQVQAEGGIATLALLAAIPAVIGAVRYRDPIRMWLAAGIVLFFCASTFIVVMLATATAPPPYPTLGEALWLSSYGCLLAALLTAIGRHARTRDPGRWLDAVVAIVAVAALCVVVVRPWSAGPGLSPLGQVTVAMFFSSDVLMLGTVIAGVLVTGGRPVRVWWPLGGGVAILAITDLVFGLRIADPSSAMSNVLDAGWPLALLLLGGFAYRAPVPVSDRLVVARHMPILPLLTSAGAIGVLVYDHYEQISDAGLWLTVTTLVLGLVRTVLVMRANGTLAESERQALTDDLTGLGNRRRLYRDLDVALAAPDAATTLALFDLDGFKAYNDGHGHLAGDALLTELSRRLAVAVGADGAAYRLGGDEFCVIATGHPATHGSVVDRALAALQADGIGASGGTVAIPGEAAAASEALRIADLRMYADKALRRTMRDLPEVERVAS